MKFMDADPAEIYLAGASNYPQVAQKAVAEMQWIIRPMNIPKICFSITAKEYLEAMRWAEKWGLTDLDPKSVAVRDFFIRHEKS